MESDGEGRVEDKWCMETRLTSFDKVNYIIMYMLVTKPRNLHYRYCPLQYWYGLQY